MTHRPFHAPFWISLLVAVMLAAVASYLPLSGPFYLGLCLVIGWIGGGLAADWEDRS